VGDAFFLYLLFKEKILSTLYERKLVKNAFFGWFNLHNHHIQQTKSAFLCKGKAMEELLKLHLDNKLAQVCLKVKMRNEREGEGRERKRKEGEER
jgi:hypothetical protein